MSYLYISVRRLGLLCGILVALCSCSEDLYKFRNVEPNQYVSAMPESKHTLLSLTPFRGPHADSLKQTGILDIQETTNYQQSLPTGIDVVYVNTDLADIKLGDSPLFREALEKITVLIDGSPTSMDAFKENLPVYFPNAQMIAYVPVDEGEDSGFETIIYGPKDNPLSSGMLLASLWAYSPPIDTLPQPYPKYDLTPPANVPSPNILSSNSKKDQTWSYTNTTEVTATQATNSVQSVQGCDANWWSRCYGANNLSVDGKPFSTPWWWITENCGRRWQIRPDDYGCHYGNEKIDWDRTYWEENEWGANNRLYISRQNCWEEKPYRGAKISWMQSSFSRKDNPKTDVIFEQKPRVLFTKTCKQCYLDMNIVTGKSKSWGVKYSTGLEVGVDAKALAASISLSASKETSQSVKVDQQSQREFWVNKCMFTVGGGVLYGRLKVTTLSRYLAGVTEYNLTIKYIREPYTKAYGEQRPAVERNITYCIRKGAPSNILGDFSGAIRDSKYYWISAGWFNKYEKRIRTFANCKVK